MQLGHHDQTVKCVVKQFGHVVYWFKINSQGQRLERPIAPCNGNTRVCASIAMDGSPLLVFRNVTVSDNGTQYQCVIGIGQPQIQAKTTTVSVQGQYL